MKSVAQRVAEYFGAPLGDENAAGAARLLIDALSEAGYMTPAVVKSLGFPDADHRTVIAVESAKRRA